VQVRERAPVCDPSHVGVHLITGSDDSLRGEALSGLVHRLVGDGDRTLMVDDFDGEYEMRVLVDAAQTPPFLTEKRVVVGRTIGQFNAEDLQPLVAYLAEPLDSTELVLVGGGGTVPKGVIDAIKKAGGHTINTTPPTSKRDKDSWINEQVAAAGVKLDPQALSAVAGWLGEEAGRLHGVLETLASTYGPGRKLTVAEVAPFLGEKGSVPPWDLTDAIDRGDTTTALSLLQRMMNAGERHPLQIMAILHANYVKLMRLDGSDARSEGAAQEVLGVKSSFQAKKALDTYRKLGHEGTVRAMELLAQADLDLRGEKDWPESLVMEVLVARLSRLGARR
jgi:DNA polymerase-3 subunit delta